MDLNLSSADLTSHKIIRLINCFSSHSQSKFMAVTSTFLGVMDDGCTLIFRTAGLIWQGDNMACTPLKSAYTYTHCFLVPFRLRSVG